MKKSFKALIALAIVAALAIPLFQCSVVLAGPPTDAYKEYIKNIKKQPKVKVTYFDGYKQSGKMKKLNTGKKTIDPSYFRYYAITDFNKDGVNDLLLSRYKTATGKGKVFVLTYKLHKVVPLYYVKGIRQGVFKTTDKHLCFKVGNSSEKCAIMMELNYDKLKLKYCTSYGKVRKASGKGYNYYTKNKKVKKKVYKANMKVVDQKITFTKI
jgi:hypothetical protein